MKVNYYEDLALSENRVDVYYREQDAEIRGLMDYLETEQVIVGRKDQTAKRIYLREIYYLEIGDRHCFAYLDSEVFQIEYNLRLFLEKYSACGFVQIGKSLVVNRPNQTRSQYADASDDGKWRGAGAKQGVQEAIYGMSQKREGGKK